MDKTASWCISRNVAKSPGSMAYPRPQLTEYKISNHSSVVVRIQLSAATTAVLYDRCRARGGRHATNMSPSRRESKSRYNGGTDPDRSRLMPVSPVLACAAWLSVGGDQRDENFYPD